jgi:endonuclease/exonuclease/phosphatase family metal-dependent hydrolase
MGFLFFYFHQNPLNMRIATYNLNNLFERPKVFELENFSQQAKEILKDYYRLCELLEKKSYANYEDEIKALIKSRVETKAADKYFQVNQVKEKLYTVSKGKINIKAAGKEDWLGWVELIKKEVNEVAVQNTARVVDAIDADVICTIEAENRIALQNFSNAFLNKKFQYSMLIDGNDSRGIDVGLYSNHQIKDIGTHIYDMYTTPKGRKEKVFSRDCAVYTIEFNGKDVHFLCNHFKSKGYGSPQSNDAKRKVQAQRVRDILESQFNLEEDYVVVAGDLNDTPTNDPLSPLLSMPHLENIIERNGPQGTYQNSKNQLDYLLVSKALADRYLDSGVERRGIYKAKGGSFDSVTKKVHQASDHAALWAEFNI